MVDYEFVRLRLRRGLLERKPEKDYQQIVADYARRGWRLVQIFAPATWGYGRASYFELIFEKGR